MFLSYKRNDYSQQGPAATIKYTTPLVPCLCLNAVDLIGGLYLSHAHTQALPPGQIYQEFCHELGDFVEENLD